MVRRISQISLLALILTVSVGCGGTPKGANKDLDRPIPSNTPPAQPPAK